MYQLHFYLYILTNLSTCDSRIIIVNLSSMIQGSIRIFFSTFVNYIKTNRRKANIQISRKFRSANKTFKPYSDRCAQYNVYTRRVKMNQLLRNDAIANHFSLRTIILARARDRLAIVSFLRTGCISYIITVTIARFIKE